MQKRKKEKERQKEKLYLIIYYLLWCLSALPRELYLF